MEFPKTHDLRALLALALPQAPELEVLSAAVEILTVFAIEPRYVLMQPSSWHVIVAIHYARTVRDTVSRHLCAATPEPGG